MPLHFFNSAVITNSKLDSWTVTTSIIFIYFSKKKKKSTASADNSNFLVLFCSTKIVIYWTCNQCSWSEICVTGKSKWRNHLFVFLLSHSWDLGPTGSDSGLSPQDSTHGHNRLGYLGWRPRVGCLLVEFLY